MNSTLIIFKPDVYQRDMFGFMIEQLNAFMSFYDIQDTSAEYILKASESLVKQHYIEHKDKSFYNELVDFLRSGPITIYRIEGTNVQPLIRKWSKAMRDLYGESIMRNLIHSSDSPEAADREIKLWFNK